MVTSFPEHSSPQGLEVPEFPASYVNRLRAEVDRLRADLADARRRIANALAKHPNCKRDNTCSVCRALSAWGGGPTEGGGDE